MYDPAGPREPGKKGAPCKKGKRQPTLSQRLSDPDTEWTRLTVAWYGRTTRIVELTSGTAVWYHSGKPVVPIRWVVICDPLGKFAPLALLSTDQNLSAQQIVEWFVLRWQLEVTFEETRAHLGSGNPPTMVGPGYPANDAGVVGTVFAGECVRASGAPRAGSASASSGLVYEERADL